MMNKMSRQDAADLLDNLIGMVDDSQGNDYDTALRMGIEALKADVQPVRHGHWVFGNTLGHSWMKCSECLVSQNGQTATYTYCPNCGARMEQP